MLPDRLERRAPGLRHYEDMLALTGRQYRFTGSGLSVGVVLGMLDARTERLPIGLVDAHDTYWAAILHYDANRRTIDVEDDSRWNAFVGTYASGGWLLGFVRTFGGTSLTLIGGLTSTIFGGFRFFFLPAILFGFTGLIIYAFIGVALASAAVRYMPYLITGVVAWGGAVRCNRTGASIPLRAH